MSIQTKISTLWIVVMLNMIFADIFSFMYPDFHAQIATGTVDGLTITPQLLLVAAFFVQIPIVMVYFSRILERAKNRLANLIAAPITILFVAGGGSLKLHYIFFASIEIAIMIYIFVVAWRWRDA